MALRFSRSIKIAPGFRINFGKTGISLSAGGRGATITAGSRGVYGNVGLPGTGLSYRTQLSSGTNRKARQNAKRSSDIPTIPLDTIAKELNADIDTVLELHHACKLPHEECSYCKSAFSVPKPDLTTIENLLTLVLLFVGLSFIVFVLKANSQGIFLSCSTFVVLLGWFLYSRRRMQKNLAEWIKNKAIFDQHESKMEEEWYALSHNPDQQDEWIERVFSEIPWPRETLINFEMKDNNTLCLDVDFPEEEDMPRSFWAVKKSGKDIEQVNRSATQIRKDYARHVHSICLLAASSVFWGLPDLQTVQISGYTQRMNKTTGTIQDDYILSARILRVWWEQLDTSKLKNIDPIEAFEAFELRRNMTKTGIFKIIEPFSI